MNLKNFLRTSAATISLVLLSSMISFGQAAEVPKPPQQVDPSYDVALHLLIGSNDAAKADLPASLSNVSKQLRANFGFPNYRLASTFLGRIANNGNFHYKSVGNLFGKETQGSPHTFLEWSVANFRNMPTAKGQPGFQAHSFAFGARVPVFVGSHKAEGSAGAPLYNYESIGLNIGRIGLAENTPTLIGTLSLPGSDGTIFLVMTIRSAEM